MRKKIGKETIMARSAVAEPHSYNDIVPPHHVSVSFSYDEFGQKPEYAYGRVGNPNAQMVGDALAKLEGGAGGVATSSGMAALDLAFHLLEPGDYILAPHDSYGGTQRLLRERAARGAFNVEFIDQSDEEALASAFEKKPKMVLIETPSNPLLKVYDIGKLSKMAKDVGALTIVDNTFLSPVLQMPLEFGCDMVMHSTTKYINGHSDVIGGVLVCADQDIHEKMCYWANCTGITASAHDSWMILRGLRTLDVRIRKQQSTAHKIAHFLKKSGAIKNVYYPGLKSHPDYYLAKEQQKGYGAMISFELNCDEDGMKRFLSALELFPLAQSLGGYDSMINHPMSMTHASMGVDGCKQAGITESLLRISVGLEDPVDLINDIEEALGAI
jgi:cystathionine gamma-synthase